MEAGIGGDIKMAIRANRCTAADFHNCFSTDWVRYYDSCHLRFVWQRASSNGLPLRLRVTL